MTQTTRTATMRDRGLIGIGQSIAYVASGIAFLMWFHRVHRNLPSLGARRLKFSPGWAVGWFFVPIMNLFRPFQVMKEVWRGGDPAVASPQTTDAENVPVSPIVGWWWAMWIIMNVSSQVSFRVSMAAKEIDALLFASWLDIASDFISLPAALLAIRVIRKVDANQQQRHLAISGSGTSLAEEGTPLDSEF